MSEIGLSDEDILAVGARAGIINAVVALPIVICSLRLMVRWQTIFRSLPFYRLERFWLCGAGGNCGAIW